MNRLTCLLICGLVSTTNPVWAQGQGQGQGGQGQGGQGGGQNGFPGGIIINADGLINAAQGQRINPILEQRRLKMLAGKELQDGLNSTSELRKISLKQLDRELKSAIEAGEPPAFELQNLAGLTSIEYVVLDRDNDDVILAGPAEGFAATVGGRVIGVNSGRPTLQLDDLLVALRLKSDNQQLGCSFDPEPSRLAQANAFNAANTAPSSAAVAKQHFVQMANLLGTWNVTVFGIPDNCHAALTAVEADFELKRLALGLVKPKIRRFYSHLHYARPGENSMRRWWLAPRYNVIERSVDENIYRLSGPRLQLMSQDELVDLKGNRSDAAFKEVSAEKYTQQFNRHIKALCEQVPSFAATQNLFDLAVVSALIRRAQVEGKLTWTPSVLTDPDALPHQSYATPTQVPSMVNVKMTGRSLLIGLIGGGVTIVPNNVINRTTELESDKLPNSLRHSSNTPNWYWD